MVVVIKVLTGDTAAICRHILLRASLTAGDEACHGQPPPRLVFKIFLLLEHKAHLSGGIISRHGCVSESVLCSASFMHKQTDLSPIMTCSKYQTDFGFCRVRFSSLT